MKALQFNVSIPKFILAKSLEPVLGKRVYYNGPFQTVQMVDIDEPALPSPDWVKIKTIFCGFCGSDLNLIMLHDSPSASPFTSMPCVMGHEIVGEIVSAGSQVNHFSPGDRVVVNPILGCETRGIDPVCPSCQNGREGGCENFAEGCLPPGMFIGINSRVPGGFAPFFAAHQSQLYKIPENLGMEAAVLVEPLAVALQTVFDNMPSLNDKVLVVGGGVIGNLIIQSIKALAPSTHVSLVEPSPFAADLARKVGADEIVHPKKVFDETRRITHAKMYDPLMGMAFPVGGFDKVYDTVGNAATLNQSLRVLRAMGTLSIVGIGNPVKLDLTPLWLKLQTVKGVFAYGKVTYEGKDRHVFDIAMEFLAKNKICADMLVTHQFRIEDYREMIEVNLNKGKHKAVKTVMSF
ncbi:MAG: alcohol dehydrogenase catalytic domain-containing protein [Proteobacteria bacterium]|nr:alcohol dehydrogenase catalytic domain-containing protein [Pseudomonadota bacterium]